MSRLYGVAGVNSGDVVYVNSSATLKNIEPFTIVLWGNPNSDGKAVTGVVARLVDSGSGGGAGYWIFRHYSSAVSTRQVAFFKNYATTDLEHITGGNIFTLNVWNHYAMSWDGTATATNVKIYVATTEATVYQSATNGAGAKQSETSSRLTIGNRGAASAAYDGTLAFAALYGRVLSQAEIEHERWFPGSHNYADLGKGGFWPLWGTPAESDDTANHNDGSLVGAAVGVLQPPINGVGAVPCPGIAL